MKSYWSKVVDQLSPYVPGEQPKIENLVKLNTNENPYGPSPKVIEAIKAKTNDDLRLYPDASSNQLRQVVADYYGIKADQVFVGNGSDEVLAHVFNALLKHDKPILFPDVTYSFYPSYCKLFGVEYTRIPLADDFSLNLDDFRQDNGGIIFPNPNAPTAQIVSLEAIEELLQHNTESVVVIDEAYIDFGGASAVTLIDRYPNLLVTQTLSKSRSLAGLRIGLAFGHAGLLEAIIRVKDSFNSYPVDQLAEAAAIAAFEDKEYFDMTCNKVIKSREDLTIELIQLGFEMQPSYANFVFARHPQHDAKQLMAFLRERGVVIRHFSQDRIEQFLRITVGTDEQNAALLTGLRAAINTD
ncbi:MAG: histidinol-phosphate transaminase [Gammaproteobacteria bacterium]|nr:histidinol-phosphate transaminase [Gammaproteobacteria bacterium]MDH5777396.1 histidinol-phosphate transaminase [Gammaproteobacteria bacterium]